MHRFAAVIAVCSLALPVIAEEKAPNPPHGAPGHVHGAGEAAPAAGPAVTATPEETAALRLQASYLLGMNFATSQLAEPVKRFDLDIAELQKGIADGLGGKPSAIDDAKAQEIFGKYLEITNAKRTAAADKRGETNATWLADNAKKPGVIQTASGLQYEVIASGKGATPKSGDQVTCHYVGTLLDGTTFDSSRARGQPATFGVGQLIAGWNEALVLMKEGDHWKLYVPPAIGYGDKGAGQIGPNEILIFDLELIKVGG